LDAGEPIVANQFNNYRTGANVGASTGMVRAQDIAGLDGIRTPLEVSEIITEVTKKSTPFTAMLEGIGSEPVGQCEFKYQFSHPDADYTNAAADATAVATTIVVSNADFIRRKSLFINTRTGEQFYVTGVSGTTLTVTRGLGSPAAAIKAGDYLQFTSIAQEEAGDPVDSVWRGTEYTTGYCQKFEATCSISDIMELRDYNGEREKDRTTRRFLLDFGKQKETAFVYGQPSVSIVDGKMLYTTAGVRYFAKQYNNFDMGRCTSYQALRRGLREVTKWGLQDPIGICSPDMADQFSTMREFTQKQRTTQAEDTLGANLNKIQFGGGLLTIVPCEVMDAPFVRDEMLIVDMGVFRKRTFEPLTQGPIDSLGSHKTTNQIYERSGLACTAPATIGRLHNFGFLN
jgi:hypothetical protein